MRRLVLTHGDGSVVCESVAVANRPWSRMRGLLGRRELLPGDGVALRPAWSIHTAFMRFPIDVVFLDGDGTVLRVVKRMPAWRSASVRGARQVVELSAGECARRGVVAGDTLEWVPVGAARPRVAAAAA